MTPPAHRRGAPPDLPPGIVAATAAICSALPEVQQEQAWVGTRWRVRTRTFAHLVPIADGWPPAYAKAVGSPGPCTVLTFRTPEPDACRHGRAGPPFFWPGWFADLAGMTVDRGSDWAAIGELLLDSYCTVAPRKLVALLSPAP